MASSYCTNVKNPVINTRGYSKKVAPRSWSRNLNGSYSRLSLLGEKGRGTFSSYSGLRLQNPFGHDSRILQESLTEQFPVSATSSSSILNEDIVSKTSESKTQDKYPVMTRSKLPFHFLNFERILKTHIFLTFFQVADLEEILSERDACGVGFIANLDNKSSHDLVEKVQLFSYSSCHFSTF